MGVQHDLVIRNLINSSCFTKCLNMNFYLLKSQNVGFVNISEQTFNKKHLRTSLKEISKDQSLKTSIISDTSDQKFMKDSTNV